MILSMPFQQYLQIAEWTAEQVLSSGTDPPPKEVESLLQDKELDPLRWQSAVDNFAAWFHHAVGKYIDGQKGGLILEQVSCLLRRWPGGQSVPWIAP